MPHPPNPLRPAFDLDVATARAAHGDGFDRSILVQEYMDRGVGRTAAYRWLNEIFAQKPKLPLAQCSKNAERAAANRASKRATDRACMPASKPASALPSVATIARMPAPPRPEDVATVGLVPVLAQINACIAMAERVRSSAIAPDGTVRNSRLALAANENHRRCLETASKINDSVIATEAMEQFHRLLISEVMQEAPACAERILKRLRVLADRYID